MADPIATAVIRVIPDGALFRADLQKVVERAVSQVRVPPVVIPVTAPGAAAAGSAAAAATSQVTALGNAGKTAAKGTADLSKSSSILRGSLIGLSHITPVTVFGLTAYGVAAIAVGTAIKNAIRSTADFEHQLNIFQATTEATAEDMEKVSELAKDLGADLTLPATSAGDAAKAMTELAKAGLSVEDTLDGAKGVLQLAAAAQIDVGSAATFVATELNAFGLAGDQATHVADLLAGASIAAQGEIRDFGTAFQQVSAVSRQVGVSLETTTGALTELARAGLRGADGGTSLRTTLLRLAPTTKQAEQYQKALGIQIDKNVSIGKQLPNLIDQYRKALLGLPPVLQQQALTQIFGQDAIRAATILIRGGSEALYENTRAADQNGAAARLAAANAKGLSGALNGLKSEADTLGITLGELVSGPMEKFTRGLGDIVGDTVDVVNAVKDMAEGVNDALRGIKIPEKLGGQKTESAIASLPGNLFALTPGLGSVYFITKAEKNVIDRIRKARKNVREEIAKARNFKAQVDAGLFGITLLPQKIGSRNFSAQKLGEADEVTAADLARAAVTAARIAAVKAGDKQKIIRPADITPPRDLQVDKLNAQINDSLRAELSADKAIEDYFQKRLGRAKEGTLRYKQILAAYASAHAATVSVQSEIESNAKSAASAAKALREQRKAEAEKEARDAAAAAKDLFNLEKSRFDLRISAAGLTPEIGDDVRANRAEIRFFNRQIKRIEAIKKRRKLTIAEQQAVVDYKSAIISLRSTIQGLKKDEGGGKGFTLRELFQEAADEFTTFGSNIATPGGILSGQDARASFAQTVLGNLPGGGSGGPADKLPTIASAQLTQAQQQTAYLSQIAAAVSHGGPGRGKIPAPVTGNRGRVGSLEAINAVQAASIWGY